MMQTKHKVFRKEKNKATYIGATDLCFVQTWRKCYFILLIHLYTLRNMSLVL